MKIRKLMLSSIALLAGVGMVSCGDMLGNDESSVFSSTQEKFSTQAVTSLSMINSLGSSNGLVRKAKLISDEDKSKIEQILPTLDLLMNNGMIFESQVVEEVVIFNDVTYNFKETISFVNESLEKSSYTLLYNLEEANDSSIKAKNDHHDDDEEDEKGHHGDQSHENNSENCTKMDEETKIFGIAMISDEVFYEFVSESEIEEHNNKKEYERTFKIIVGEKDYILVEEENEVKNNKTESSFEYTVVENGAKVLNYSISIENKNNKDVIEYEIDDVEYEIKRTMNESGEEIYKIEVENEHDYEFVVCYKKVTNEDGSISFVSM